MSAAALLSVSSVACAAASPGESFRVARDDEKGVVSIHEGEQPVLRFVTGPRLAEGAAEQYRREGYLHPVYGLDGKPVTGDFPADHYHHRGVWLSWPTMFYRGEQMQLWHPSKLRQKFDRVVKQVANEKRALLVVRNHWVLDGEPIGYERWRITVHNAENGRRAVDVTITFSALEEPIRVQGKQNQRKGYGGLTVRTSERLGNGRLMTSKGPLENDSVQQHFAWAGISTDKRGLAVFVSPSNPNSPPPWLLRNSYGGVLNPEWPGLTEARLEPRSPLTLRYRLLIHDGSASQSVLQKAYERWVQQRAGESGGAPDE